MESIKIATLLMFLPQLVSFILLTGASDKTWEIMDAEMRYVDKSFTNK